MDRPAPRSAIRDYLDRSTREAWPVPRDPDNPAENDMTDADNDEYAKEQLT